MIKPGLMLVLPAVCLAVTATAQAAPSVSSVSGSITQGSTITVSGSSFGSGPNVVVFDDFEGGTDGEYIMTGSGSALVGEWASRSGEAYYSNDYSVSGSLCFEADMSGYDTRGKITGLYSSGAGEIFTCWWVRIPQNIPGENHVDGLNWKHVWVMGNDSTIDDDLTPVFLGETAQIYITGNCGPVGAWTGWDLNDEFYKGDWLRKQWYIKGGYTDGYYKYDFLHEDGTKLSVERTGRTWGHRDNDELGLPRQYERAIFNGYGRQEANSYPRFDDCYMAVGSSCRARVEIGNASTYSSCTDLAISGPTSWSSGSITAKCNIGGLNAADDWYLFVVDAAGDASAGYQVTGGPTYTLTVNSGSGDGNYTESTVVDITADTAPSGKEFDEWIGDTSGIADVSDPTTTLTMPAANQEVTATYTDATYYTLTVHSGTGDGNYIAGTVVDIDADTPPSGKQFDEWVGDTGGIANVSAASTTLTMPAADATVTATYEDAPSGTTQLVVNWGDSEANNVYDFSDWTNVYLGPYQEYSSAGPDGIVGSTTANYSVNGVNGSAESFSEGDQIVVTWYNNTGSQVTFTPSVSFDDEDYRDGGSSTGTWYDMTQLTLDDAETGTSGYTFTSGTAGSYNRVHVCRGISNTPQMLCDRIELVTGGGAPQYTLTVNSGTGDGSYTENTIVDIDADTAPSGSQFDEWIGDTSGIANVNAASTTLTMPAANQEITATYTDTGPIDDVATGETAVKGTVSGDYTDTQSSNDTYESITEVESKGNPASRYSYLEHKWTFNVTGGSTVTFYIEAYKTDNSENDDFVFAYSTNGEDWTNMVTVTKTSDDDSTQSYELPSSLSGTTYVRVKDTDQTAGNKSLDTIYVDHMFIRSE